MDVICSYLEYCLQKHFFKYPTKIIENYKDCIQNAFVDTLFDINEKYKKHISIKTQYELIELIEKEPTIEATFLYRLEREIFLREESSILLPYLACIMHRQTGCEIYYSSNIGLGLNIQHGIGIVIGPRYKIGENFTIHQGVTLGQKNLNSPNETIIIGDNVTIFAGSILLGNISIGDNAIIGANSVVLSSVEANSIYVGSPAKRIK